MKVKHVGEQASARFYASAILFKVCSANGTSAYLLVGDIIGETFKEAFFFNQLLLSSLSYCDTFQSNVLAYLDILNAISGNKTFN